MINEIALDSLGIEVALAAATAVCAGGFLRTRRRPRESENRAEDWATNSRAREAAVADFQETRLPALVHAVTQGHSLPAAPPPADDFDKHLRAAEEIVVRALSEARARAGEVSQGTLLSIARTLQGLTNQQQVSLTNMMKRHDSEEFLADLLPLDHTTAQLLRRATTLAVACGSWPGRQHDPTTVLDVVRGAVGRILDYKRVQIAQPQSNRAVIGKSVEGLAIALAELLENATRYSHPDTVVQVQFQASHTGLSIVIDDAGVTLPPGERLRAARLLTGTDPIDMTQLGTPPKFGFAVIGALARRYGFTASVDSISPYGGVRAVVHLPSGILTDVRPQPATAQHGPAPAGTAASAPPLVAGTHGKTSGGLPKRRRLELADVPGEAAPSTPAARPVPPEEAAAPFDAFLRATHASRTTTTDEGNSTS